MTCLLLSFPFHIKQIPILFNSIIDNQMLNFQSSAAACPAVLTVTIALSLLLFFRLTGRRDISV